MADFRVLLIDNYDSYTYNLVHLVHAVLGALPVVVRNDAFPSWPALLAAHSEPFHAVLISPGPGHPSNPRDFGLCGDALASGLPLLGVCLGHQGIAAAFAATVRRNFAGPRHGIPSPVRHVGGRRDPLFRDVPQRFFAMRYHSLQVILAPGSSELVATAWADDDGTVMALRHTSRPLFGVQFHPESVATQHGTRLVENFFAVARGVNASPRLGPPSHNRNPPTRRNVLPGPLPQLHAAPLHLHVRHLYNAPVRNHVGLFSALCPNPELPAFWLDSPTSASPQASRFSFLGDTHGPHSRFATYTISPRRRIAVTTPSTSSPEIIHDVTIFDFLDAHLSRMRRAHDPALPFHFDGGFVGYLGYEARRDCDADPRSPSHHVARHPDAAFVFADRLVVLDNHENSAFLLCLTPHQDNLDGASRAWMDRAEAAVRANTRAPESPPATVRNDDAPAAPPPIFTMERGEEEYLDDIRKCLAAIVQGESYEVCLTNRIRTATRVRDALALYATLRALNPAPHAAFLRLSGALAVCSSSPESFLRVRPDGRVSSRPIKGTQPRGRTQEEDRLLRCQLAASVKDRAENLMIVDLVRNDIGRVCGAGTVQVPALTQIETYPTLHQMVSTVTGRLRDGVSPVEAVRVAYPMGSMTGAPKLRTMEIIDNLEHSPRGVYSGAIGFFGLSGGVDLNVVIRTAVVSESGVEIGVGGAIVALSDPAAEWREVVLKGKALMRAVAVATTGADSFILEGDQECEAVAVEPRPMPTPVTGHGDLSSSQTRASETRTVTAMSSIE